MDGLPNSKDIIALKQKLQPLKIELKRTTEEREILKKAAAYLYLVCPIKVGIYWSVSSAVSIDEHVPCTKSKLRITEIFWKKEMNYLDSKNVRS